MSEHDVIQSLEATGRYRVLERLQAPERYQEGSPQTPRIGIVIDTETTGIDIRQDKIIELGFVAFEYDATSGLIYRILHTFDGFEDPKEPLSDIVKRITGIDDAMLVGQALDDAEIEPWLLKADLVIAHNAAFDRPMLERRFTKLEGMAWACTFKDIDWDAENIASRKLDYIAFQLGYFFDGHRAVNDAQATLHLLTCALPTSKQLAMGQLLMLAREVRQRFFAIAAPFDKKDVLKERSYQWIPEFVHAGTGKKGVWSKAVADSDAAVEKQWLTENIYVGKKAAYQCKSLTARERYALKECELP